MGRSREPSARPKKRAIAAASAALLSLGGLSGCASLSDPARPYVSPALSHAARLRTAIVLRPAAGLDEDALAVVCEAVAAELEATGRFAPTPLPRALAAPLAQEAARWQKGPPASTLVALARDRGTEALAILSVRRFDPYPPAQLSFALDVASTETGALLFSGAMALDASESARFADSLSMERLARLASRELVKAVSMPPKDGD
jgi:hypothetical protein